MLWLNLFVGSFGVFIIDELEIIGFYFSHKFKPKRVFEKNKTSSHFNERSLTSLQPLLLHLILLCCFKSRLTQEPFQLFINFEEAIKLNELLPFEAVNLSVTIIFHNCHIHQSTCLSLLLMSRSFEVTFDAPRGWSPALLFINSLDALSGSEIAFFFDFSGVINDDNLFMNLTNSLYAPDFVFVVRLHNSFTRVLCHSIIDLLPLHPT